jgi:hypothetical protein
LDPYALHAADEPDGVGQLPGIRCLSSSHPFDGEPDGLRRSYQDRELLGPCEASVHQIATEQQIVLHEQGEYDDWVLTPLTFVDRHSPGKSGARGN